MAEIQFVDEDTHRSCCDLAFMRRRYGEERARAISRRLQQLAALSSMLELDALPFGRQAVEEGLEIEVAPGLALVIDATAPTTGEPHMTDLNITVVLVRSPRVASK